MGSPRLPELTFAEAVEKLLEPALLPWWSIVLGRGAVIGVCAGLGALLHALTRPSFRAACTVTVVVIAAGVVWRLRSRNIHHHLIGRIDWDTAPAYWAATSPAVPPTIRSRITQVVTETRARYRDVAGVHPYLIPCPDDIPDGTCTHFLCLNAAVYALGEHRVIAIGRRMLRIRGNYVEAALRHEMRHATGWMTSANLVISSMVPTVWFGAGYVPAGLWGPLAAWALLGGIRWADELVADLAAVRVLGARAVVGLLHVAHAQERSMSLHGRLISALISVLFPTHPPLRLRCAVACLAGR